MKLTVLGCGRWGTFLACYHSARNEVMLWGRPGSRAMAQLKAERKNSYIELPEQLQLTEDLTGALEWVRNFLPVIENWNEENLAYTL